MTQSADDLVRRIFTAMDEFSQGRQNDDATVVVMRVQRAKNRGPAVTFGIDS